jgi:hypothetical protein
MKEEIISFETAKLSKEKGFYDKDINGNIRISQNYIYFEDGSLHEIREIFDNSLLKIPKLYNAPTQHLLQKWLREIHNIELWVQPVTKDLPEYESYKNFEYIYIGFDNKKIGFSGAILGYSYEQTLEIGLFEALNKI